MFESLRNWGKSYLYLDLICTAAWCTAAVIFSGVFLVIVVVRGDYDAIPDILGTLLPAVTILGFMTWISRDARRASRALRRERRPARPRRNGDMSDVAGLRQQPPWM